MFEDIVKLKRLLISVDKYKTLNGMEKKMVL